MGLTLLAARLLLAAVCAVAGLTKLMDHQGARQAIIDFGLPTSLASPLAIFLPLAELVVAAALVPTTTAWLGSLGALVLLLAFTAGIGINLARGKRPDCHCFGQLHSEPVGRQTLARNGLLLLMAGLVVVLGRDDPGPSAVAWIARLTTGEQVALVVGVVGLILLAVQGWFVLHLLQQQGRLLLRIDALDAAIAGRAPSTQPAQPSQPPVGLPVGSPAPSFALGDLNGGTVSLDDLRAAGKPVALFFTDPHCGPCSALLPDLVHWQRQYADRLTLALISRGGIAENRAKTDEHELTHVLLQEDREVASVYQAHGTPSAVIIQSDGTVGSPVAPGADAIRALLARTLGLPTSPLLQILPHAPTPVPAPHGGNGHAPSRTLRVGDPAPAIRLPDLSGNVIDLNTFQGREAIILFWNPGCGFCQRMLPDLKEWEANLSEGAPKLLVISTGTVEANRGQGILSPVLLDQGFSVGQSFGANGTPMAVLVDPAGKIASELAAGAPAVLTLLTRATAIV